MRLNAYLEIINELAPYGGIPTEELVQRIKEKQGIHRTQIYYMLANMEKEGLIFRKVCWEGKKKRKCIYPAKKLRDFYSSIINKFLR